MDVEAMRKEFRSLDGKKQPASTSQLTEEDVLVAFEHGTARPYAFGSSRHQNKLPEPES